MELPLPKGHFLPVGLKLKTNIQIGYYFQPLCRVKGKCYHHSFHVLEGERISDDDTPEIWDLEDGDQIGSILEQVGC